MAAKKPYNAKGSYVYHTDSNCTVGNNIEKENKQNGTKGKRKCKICKK